MLIQNTMQEDMMHNTHPVSTYLFTGTAVELSYHLSYVVIKPSVRFLQLLL